MYEVLTLNKIAKCGLDKLDNNVFSVTDEVKNPDAIILRSFKMHDMELGDNLKCVARAGAGTNNIPIDKCSQKGIVVFNTPGANANAVAELTVAGLLLASRKISDSINWAKGLKGEGDNVGALVEKGKSAFAGPEILGKKLAVAGLGAIGAKVAKLAQALGMEVVGYDPFITEEAAKALGNVEIKAELSDLVADCDYISMHMPLNDATRGIIGDKMFALMKPGTRLLNFSRGELVDSAALKKAIDAGTIACYVVDFPNEETLGMDNVINIPHLGASTPESEDNCAIMAAKELSDFIRYGSIVNSVNYPNLDAAMSGKYRVTVAHKASDDMLANLTAAFADANIAVTSIACKAKKDNGYAIIDVDADPKAVAEKIAGLDGVYKVRIIEG